MGVLGWKKALDEGHNPSEYPYKGFKIGDIEARLDFTIWAKKVSAINCYFTNNENHEKFQITIHRDRETEEYILDGIDFRTCPNGLFKMQLELTRTNKVKVVSISQRT